MGLTFEPILTEGRDAYREKLSQCGQIASDYSFINIWGWGPEYGLEWAWQDGLVWIRQNNPKPVLWAPVGDWATVNWSIALETAKSAAERMIRVPENLLARIQQSVDLPVPPEETRDHWDYLYSVEELVELKGNKFHKKKNLFNQFINNYEYAYQHFGDVMIEKSMEMQADWCTWRDCENNDTLAAENKAIARVLNDWQTLPGITGGALIVKEMIVAYTIAETMPDNTLIIHFEKGCPDCKGSYQAINQMFLAHAPQGYTLVNREQDLGDEGLRKAKLSYHPVGFVKKYRISL